MNDAEGRRTLLWEMNGSECIEDGNKNQRGHYSIKTFLCGRGHSMYLNRN